MKKLLIVLFVLTVVFYTNATNPNETAQVNGSITTYDLPLVH